MPISKLHLRLHGGAGTPTSEEIKPPTASEAAVRPLERIQHLWDKTLLLRYCVVTVLALLLGSILFLLLSPILPAELTAAILNAHLPGDTPSTLVWLRLCAARLPVYFLLALAGMTRFSGGLTTAVLAYRGLCDGAACLFLLTLPSASVTESSVGLTVSFIGWMLADAALRCFMAAEARRMAEEMSRGFTWSEDLSREKRQAIRYRLWRYLMISLGGICVSLLLCSLYAAALTVMTASR